MIKYYICDGSLYIVPQYSDKRSFTKTLMEVAQQASKAREEAGAAHAVYAVKTYGEDNTLDYVEIYNPPVLLTDQEFERRTTAEYKIHPGCVICASHAHE